MNRIVSLISILLFCLLFTLIPFNVSAQSESFLRILVISDDDGNPVLGATALLFDPQIGEDSPFIHAGVTNRDGLTEFRGVAPGKYLLVIRYIGHTTYRNEIDITPGSRENMRIMLETTVGELDAIEIREQRYITTGEVGLRRITPADIGRVPSPGPGGDISAYLQTLPGVVTIGDQGGDLYIRGGTPDQNLILIDNLPIIKPFHISNLFSAFSDRVIQTADLYAGGFDTRYTGATSSVLDIRLRPGNMRETRGMAALSPYMTALQLEGPIERDRQSFLLMGRVSTIEYTAPYLTGRDNEIRFYDVLGRYTVQGQSISCNFTGVLTHDEGEINPLREFNLSWSNTVIGARCLGFDRMFSYPLEVTFGYTGYTNREGSALEESRSSSIRHIFLNVDNRGNMFNHPVNYGFGLTLGSYSARLAERFTAVKNFDVRNPVLNFYMSTEFHPTDNLTIRPGIATQMSIDASPTFEPRARLSYRPGSSGEREISLAAGRYYQFLSGISDERDAGTVFMVWLPRTRGEPVKSSTHLMMGFQDKLHRTLNINTEVYVKWHENIPVSKWTPVAELEIETANARGFTYGFDASIKYENNQFYSSIGYGFSVVEYEAISGDLGAWIEEEIFAYNPPHDQRHKFNAMAGIRVGEYNFSSSWEFGSGQPFTQVLGFELFVNVPMVNPTESPGVARTLFSRPYGERLPTYHRLDVAVERGFKLQNRKELLVKVGAMNIYNRSNIFYYDLNTLQRVDQTPLMPYFAVEFTF